MGMLLAVIAVIVGASITYAKTFGPYQTQLTEIVVTTFSVTSRYKPAVNLAVGILLAGAVTVVAAAVVGNTAVLAAGLVAGVFGSIEAQRVHDTQNLIDSATPVSGANPKVTKYQLYH